MRSVWVLVLALFVVGGCAASVSAKSHGNNAVVASDNVVCEGAIAWTQASGYDGHIVTVRGPIVAARYAGAGQPTYLDVGKAAPAPDRVMIVISAAARKTGFTWAPERVLNGQSVCARGVVRVHQDATELDLTDEGNVFLLSNPAK